MTPESTLKAAVKSLLEQSGRLHFRMNSGKILKGSHRAIQLHPDGTADYLVFLSAHPMWLELKAPKAKPDPKRDAKQAAFKVDVLARGHSYGICSTVDEVRGYLGL